MYFLTTEKNGSSRTIQGKIDTRMPPAMVAGLGVCWADLLKRSLYLPEFSMLSTSMSSADFFTKTNTIQTATPVMNGGP